MVRLGKVYGNLMVDLRPGSAKLRDRALRIIETAGKVSRETAENLYEVAGSETNPDARTALQRDGILMDREGTRYDFVMAFQVLEHLDDTRTFLSELVGKLNRGGHLLLTVPNPESVYSQTVYDPLDYPPHHMTRWSMAALENIKQFFPLKKVAVYQEPLRIEHFRSMIVARRQRLAGNRIFGRIMQRIGDVFDALYVPFAYGQCNENGHTHGIVFVKTD